MSDIISQPIGNGQAVLHCIGRMGSQCPCPFKSRQRGIKQYFFLSVSLGVCRGLGADFRRKSEIRKPALWGRKAGTDRVREGIPEGFRPTEQACAL